MDPYILRQTAADVSDTSDSEGPKNEHKSVSSSAVNQSCITLNNAADKLRIAVTNRYLLNTNLLLCILYYKIFIYF